MKKGLFVTGISTEVGKTVCSAILVEALKADYWKPVQTGTEEGTDRDSVKNLTLGRYVYHPEIFTSKWPISPHRAAELDERKICAEQCLMPKSSNFMVVEGAGGALTPLNKNEYIIDIALKNKLPALVVSKYYLGSLNHTFLTVEALRIRNIKILGLVFNGEGDPTYEDFICTQVDLPPLFSLKQESSLTPLVIKKYAASINLDYLKNALGV